MILQKLAFVYYCWLKSQVPSEGNQIYTSTSGNMPLSLSVMIFQNNKLADIKWLFFIYLKCYLFSAKAPVITAPGSVSVTCDQIANFKQVLFSDVDVGDTPTISITNPAAPNDIFTINANDGMHFFL